MLLALLIVLGIDPGTTSVGYAVVECTHRAPKLLTAGLITTRGRTQREKLGELHQRMSGVIREWRPGVLTLERLFFAKNKKTAFAVAEARGVILLTSALAGLEVFEYTPLEIKKVITGNGHADKLALKKMLLLTIPGLKDTHFTHTPGGGAREEDNIYDAIASSLTFCYKRGVDSPRYQEATGGSPRRSDRQSRSEKIDATAGRPW